MKTLRLLAVLVGIVVVQSGAMASRKGGVYWRGAPSCGTWIQERQSGKENWSLLGDEAWLLGYLSGLGAGADRHFWGEPNVNVVDNESVFVWVDNYCRAHPLLRLADAGDAIFVERTGPR